MNQDTHLALNVSRETMEKFAIYAELLKKWNPKINLVAKSTIQNLWDRHIYDSVQFFDLINKDSKKWVDIGSGGGFPGIILAIMAAELPSSPEVLLVESDQRKAVFLRTVLRETEVSAKVLTSRIEETPPLKADVLTARALADLPKLLQFADLHLANTGTALFAKGANWKKELSEARLAWQFECKPAKSKTDPDAVILQIQGLTHV